MRKVYVSLVLALGTLLVASSFGWAGLCLQPGPYCNADYLALLPAGPGLFELHGYEYGCVGSTEQTHSAGTLSLAGNTVYIGLTRAVGPNWTDYSMIASRHAIMSLSTMSGTYLFNYAYIVGGVIDGHGGSADATMSICSGPSATAGAGPNETIPE